MPPRAAEQHALSAIRTDPGASDVAAHHSIYAEALIRQGKWAEAATAFETLSSFVPHDAMPHLNQGAALLQLQRPSEAAARFARALELARRAPAGDARQRAAAEKARVGLEMARKN